MINHYVIVKSNQSVYNGLTMKRRHRGRRKRFFKFKLRNETIYSITAVIFFAAAAIIAVSFFQQDTPILIKINNLVMEYFGYLGYFVPTLLISLGFICFRVKLFFTKPNVALGLFLSFLSLMGMGKSGILGAKLWQNIEFFISPIGAWFLFFGALIIGMSIFFNTSLDEIAMFIVNGFVGFYKFFFISLIKTFTFKKEEKAPFGKKEMKVGGQQPLVQNSAPIIKTSQPLIKKTAIAPYGLPQTTLTNSPQDSKIWEYPPLSLLEDSHAKEADRGDIKHNAHTIEQTLDSFGIQAHVAEVNLGPAVTQYALEIALGTKLSKITALSTDLALALAAPTGQIRIEAPIPGRSLVGVEVPNRSLRVVTLKEMLSSDTMAKTKSKLAVALGLDVSGKPVITDINNMPHVLVAGTTGSGKSVMINSWISSLLFRTTPQEVRLIMVDPKRVELTFYDGIPHLLTPVIVEVDQTLSALKWAKGEMDRRYKLFASEGARNITSYNEMRGFQAIPYIVIFIDELADLMAYAPTEVEDSITRLAQMARATGIHLVLSTQRPSVDVITGLIKANIPSRIAFNVSSMIDSRVILDTPGAEKLLGRGDMLYIPPDQAKPSRIQGTYISEKDVKRLVDFLKNKVKEKAIPLEYTQEVVQQKVIITKPSGMMVSTDGKDSLFEEAKQIIVQYDRASASLLQRRLKIGYARAARILDQLEEIGMVGPAEGSKPREVLVRGVVPQDQGEMV